MTVEINNNHCARSSAVGACVRVLHHPPAGGWCKRQRNGASIIVSANLNLELHVGLPNFDHRLERQR